MLIDKEDTLQIDMTRIFARLKKETLEKIQVYERVCDQAESSIHYIFGFYDTPQWSLRENVNSKIKEKESCLRCGLAEFVGMEDALLHYVDEQKRIKINDSKDPILHFVRELRNFEIHIKGGTVRTEKRRFLYSDTFLGITEKEWDIDIDILEIEFHDIKKLRNIKRYTDEEVLIMKESFDQLQKIWGYQEVVRACVEKYCSMIIDEYKL